MISSRTKSVLIISYTPSPIFNRQESYRYIIEMLQALNNTPITTYSDYKKHIKCYTKLVLEGVDLHLN